MEIVVVRKHLSNIKFKDDPLCGYQDVREQMDVWMYRRSRCNRCRAGMRRDKI